MNASLSSFFLSREDDVKERFIKILKEFNPQENRPIHIDIVGHLDVIAKIRHSSVYRDLFLELHPKFFRLSQDQQLKVLKHEALHVNGYRRHDWMFRSAAKRHNTASTLGEIFNIPISVFAETRKVGEFADQDEARAFARKVIKTEKAKKVRIQQVIPEEFQEFFHL